MITILGKLKLLNLGITPIKEPVQEMEIPERWVQPMVDEMAREIDRNILERLIRLREEQREMDRQRERIIQPINVPYQPWNPYQPNSPYQPYAPQQPFTAPWTIPNPYSPWVGDPLPNHQPYVGDPLPNHEPWTISYTTSTTMKSEDEANITVYCNAVANNLKNYARSNAK
jgi:hypothetical protein